MLISNIITQNVKDLCSMPEKKTKLLNCTIVRGK